MKLTLDTRKFLRSSNPIATQRNKLDTPPSAFYYADPIHSWPTLSTPYRKIQRPPGLLPLLRHPPCCSRAEDPMIRLSHSPSVPSPIFRDSSWYRICTSRYSTFSYRRRPRPTFGRNPRSVSCVWLGLVQILWRDGILHRILHSCYMIVIWGCLPVPWVYWID